MKPKIIVADDSQTIQKVIKITLASEDYELIECLGDESLISLVKENQPAVVLLDFNLSENKTGYDIAKEIKAINNSRIMMLYGTFDSIDESLLDAAGVNNHIVKPFDGNKFITHCREMVDEYQSGDSALATNSADEEIEFEDFEEVSENSPEELEVSQDGVEAVEIDDSWVVDQPEVEEIEEPIKKVEEPVETNESIVTKEEMTQLEAGMMDWGIDVPGVIGNEDSVTTGIELPPVIGGDGTESAQIVMEKTEIQNKIAKAKESAQKAVEEVQEPVQEPIQEPVEEAQEVIEEVKQETLEESPEELDLEAGLEVDFDQSEITQPIDIDEILKEDPDNAPLEVESSEAEESGQELEGETVLPNDEDLEYPDMLEISSSTEEQPEILNNLTPLDEMNFSDDSMPEEDEGIDINATLGTNTEEEVNEIRKQIAEDKEDHGNLWKTDSSINEPLNQNVPVNIEISDEQISEKLDARLQERLEELLEPMVERMVQEKVDQIIEKISWEVIPDLAENLIKRELQNITNEVLGAE